MRDPQARESRPAKFAPRCAGRRLQSRVIHCDPRSRIGCRCGLRHLGQRRASFDAGLGEEAGVEELERPQQPRVFLGSVSCLLSYRHANDLRFWIAVKTTFAVVSFRNRTTRTLLSPMSVP